MLFRSNHFTLTAGDGIATLRLDCGNSTENRLSLSVLDELELALSRVREMPPFDVLVFRSGKTSGFIHGADDRELQNLRHDDDASAWAARGQQVLQQLTHLSTEILTLAFIEGPCLGVGLELALACDYRIATARPDTVFRFDEVAQGRVPCWGGTQRLPRLIGLAPALRMLLKGEGLSARQALKVGLIDDTFCERRSRIDLRSFLDRLQDQFRKPPVPRKFGTRLRQLLPLFQRQARKQAQSWLAEIPEQERPAAHEIYRCVEAGFASFGEGLGRERRAAARLLRTPHARVSLQQIQLVSQPIRLFPAPLNPVPKPPERIAIVGGGDLGTVLARWFALRGKTVLLKEVTDVRIAQSDARLEALFADAIERGWVTPLEAIQANRRIRRTVLMSDLEKCDLVIEAATEDVGAKRQIFDQLEASTLPRTILATASSTVSVEAIAAELENPGRVCGIHFIGDVDSDPLIELVRGMNTDIATIAAMDTWLRGWGRSPVLVSDRPGRIVLRLMMIAMSEAVELVAEGHPPDKIDAELLRLGMTTGPLETIDRIGFDRLAELTESMQIARGDDFCQLLLLERARAAGFRGQQNGEGFYRWKGERKQPNELIRMVLWNELEEDAIAQYHFDPEESLREGVERIVLRTINEAAACLSDETDADPAGIDLLMSLGAGWLPHRGGPLRMADEVGLTIIAERLAYLAEKYGRRFEPNLELQRRVEAGESFHGTTVAEVLKMPQPAVLRRAG